MNVLQAMEDTLVIAGIRGMKLKQLEESLSHDHLCSMLFEMRKDDFSYGKQCRWLGWAQAAVVASGVATLEEMKDINRRNKND